LSAMVGRRGEMRLQPEIFNGLVLNPSSGKT
jgi:hypothetical protein